MLLSNAQIGQSVRQARESARLGQDAATRALTSIGCKMTRVELALVEIGKRTLTLPEFLGLLQVLGSAGVTLRQLVNRLEEAARPPGPENSRIMPGTVALTASGAPPQVSLSPSLQRRRAEDERLWKAILGRGPEFPTQIGTDVDGAPVWTRPADPAPSWVDNAIADAEVKVAATRKVRPEAVVLASWKRWGMSLTEKREQQFHRTGDARRDQAARGHISRQLIAEITPLLDAVRRARPRRKKTR